MQVLENRCYEVNKCGNEIVVRRCHITIDNTRNTMGVAATEAMNDEQKRTDGMRREQMR